MEELQKSASSETNLSDDWTLVNDNTPDTIPANGEAEETSDAESLEVLEVEHAEANPNALEEETSENSESELHNLGDPNESDGSVDVMDIPVIHIVATRRMKKYIHHPNAYINMWLSIMMVIAIAVALGLGMGHYLGMKRYSKSTDIIQGLLCKNHLLEMENAKLACRQKTCERKLYETGNIFNDFLNVNNEVEFPEEDKSEQEDSLHLSKETSISFPPYDLGEEDNSPMPFIVSFLNQNFSDMSRMKGDHIVNSTYFSFGKLKEVSEHILSPRLHVSLVVLNSEVSSLNFLLKKWNQCINKNILSSDVEHRYKYNHEEHSSTTQVPSCKGVSKMKNEKSCNEIRVCRKTFLLIPSHNNCCRSQLNLNKKSEDKLKLSGERNKVPASVYNTSFKENKSKNLALFPGVGNESSMFAKDSNKHDRSKASKLYKKNKNKNEKFIQGNIYKRNSYEKYSKNMPKYSNEGNLVKQKNFSSVVHDDTDNLKTQSSKEYDKTFKHSKGDSRSQHSQTLHSKGRPYKGEEEKKSKIFKGKHSETRQNDRICGKKSCKFHKKQRPIDESKVNYHKSFNFPKKDNSCDKKFKYSVVKGNHNYGEKRNFLQNNFERESRSRNKKYSHEKLRNFDSDNKRNFKFNKYSKNEKSFNRKYTMYSYKHGHDKNKKYHEKKKPLNNSRTYRNEKGAPLFDKMKFYLLQLKTFKAYKS